MIPYDAIAYLTDQDELSFLKLFRILRLLRLFQLLRMFRASRIFARWESHLSMSYSMLTLIKFVSIILVSSHWVRVARV